MVAATLPRHSSRANLLEHSAYQLELEINQLARAIRSRQQLQDVEKRLDAIAHRLGKVKPHSKYAELRQHFLALVAAVSLYFAAATASGVGVGESLQYQPVRIENVRQVSEGSPKTIRNTIRTPSLGVRTQPVGQTVGVKQLMDAIIGQESGGKYHLVNPHSGALGFAQLMPENVRPWTKEALGYSLTPDEFLRSPKLQIKTIQHKLNQYITQQSAPGRTTEEVVRRVASVWYSGQAKLWNHTKPQFYNGHPYPSIAEYTKSVWKKYQRLGAVAPVPVVENQSQLNAQKIVDYMKSKGYEVATNPGEVNFVFIRNQRKATNKWVDRAVAIKFENGKPTIAYDEPATSMPGFKYIYNGRSDGAPFLKPGQYKVWQLGTHTGLTGRFPHRALVQTGGAIKVYRDADKSGWGENPNTGWFGINFHATTNESSEVRGSSAGCLVVKGPHSRFKPVVELAENDPRYKQNSKFVFAVTIIQDYE